VADLKIVTYPRSGSNFLFYYLKNTTDFNITKTHDKVFNNKNIITIIRDPFESISSMITMQYKDLEKYTHNHQFACDARIQQYENFYNYILQNIDFIIDFNNIENKIEELSTLLCKTFGGNKINDIKEVNKFEWFKKTAILEEGNIPTSKTHKYYELSKESLSNYSLSKCYKLYNQVLAKSII
jgi:hypothetical protein